MTTPVTTARRRREPIRPMSRSSIHDAAIAATGTRGKKRSSAASWVMATTAIAMARPTTPLRREPSAASTAGEKNHNTANGSTATPSMTTRPFAADVSPVWAKRTSRSGCVNA